VRAFHFFSLCAFLMSLGLVDMFERRKGPVPLTRLSMKEAIELREIKVELGIYHSTTPTPPPPCTSSSPPHYRNQRPKLSHPAPPRSPPSAPFPSAFGSMLGESSSSAPFPTPGPPSFWRTGKDFDVDRLDMGCSVSSCSFRARGEGGGGRLSPQQEEEVVDEEPGDPGSPPGSFVVIGL
jgi:hypothetical protein